MKWGKTFVIHPYLIGLFPVLFLYSRNVAEMRFEGILLPALVILLGVAFLDLFMRPLGWDCHRRALLLSLLLSLFFSFGPLNEMVRTLLFNGTQESAWPIWLVSVLSVALLGLATLRLSRYRGDLSRLTQLVNAVALVLILVQVGTAIHGWSGRGNTITSDTYEPTAFLENDRNPDIYLIVLDAYARSDILQELYDYDNGEFIDNLRQRGFYVADSSRSNYVSTAQSLTSLLNMNYLHRFMATDARQFSRLPTALMLENNRVTAFLKKYGYQTVAFATGYAPTEIDYADYYLKSGVTLSEFENHLLNQTPLPLLLGRFRVAIRSAP